jgi:hypothetical protein
MNSLMYGGAAAALLMGLAAPAHAEIAVRESPVHAVPMEEDDAPALEAAPLVKAEAAPPVIRAEPAPVKALTQPKAAPARALTPEENAFFAALGQRVTDAASAYETFVRRAGAIDPAFNGSASVQHAVKVGAAYQSHQLEEGIVAYAALIALRNPEFVEGVRAMQSPAFADGLASHPERVMQVRGAAAAAADAAGVLRAQGEALVAAGKRVTKAAYDIQGQSWSKSPVADPKGVLDAAKTSADEMRTATVPSKEKLLDSLVTAPQTADGSSAPAPDVVRGLALAALAIQGRTGDGMEAQYEALLGDPSSEQCLHLAKLNLNQCLAVAGPNYEDAYCTGRHAVSDTGKCITAAADGGPALDAGPQPKLADAIGPEQASVYGKPAPKEDADDADEDDDVQTAPAPALAAAPAPVPAQAPAPAPRQYAQGPAIQAPPAAAPAYAPPQQQPQTYSYAQNDYAPPPVQAAPYPSQAYPAYPQQQYPSQYPQPQYQQPQYQPQYRQPQYQYQSQPYQQPYQQPYPQAQYAPQPYQQPQYAPQPYSPYPSYSGGQAYYPQPPQGYPAYANRYYGR